MADNLIFRIGFDLEKGVKDAQAQMDSALRRLQKTADGKPLTIPISLDPSKFTTFESALRGSIQHITDDAKSLKAALDSSLQTDNSANINRITEAMRSLEAAWKALPNNQKFDINDRLTPKAQEMIRQFNELATASSTYGQTLSQIAGKIKRVADEEAKANQTRNDGYVKLRKTLGAQENSIANLSAKIKAYQQILNSKEIGSRSFERVAEKIRKLSEKLDAARAKIKALTQTAVSSNAKHAQSVNHVTQEYQKQDGYVSRLLKRLAVYASFQYASQFLTNIREVTAQFELQRISLGAIIQDQQKANQIFAEIKSFALTSPLKILDLTKYTKQVAAYGFETEKLFDTTKMLADISVGLGVDMSRLTLFLGQVFATGYLRAAELRQATELGIPLVDKLAKKLEELNGRAYTAAEVMDMISKRAISYELVEQVFKDMTSAGGEFYNMQIKQSQTLFGMWSKLGDAAALMYDQIGNTSSVNSAMKTTIGLLETMMRNWKTTARVLDTIAVALGVYVIGLKNASVASKAVTVAEGARLAITNAQVIATPKLVAAIVGQNAATTLSTTLTKAHTVAMLKHATATNILSKSFWKLTAAMLANPWVATAAAVAGVAAAIIHFTGNAETAAERAEKLNNSVASLKGLTTEVEPLIDTYIELADKTERTADEQKKLNEVATELAQKFPAAITVIKEYGQEMGLAADEVARLYENMKRMKTEDVRQKLTENENAVNKLIQRRQQLQKYFDEGKMWSGGGGTGGGGGAMVAMSDEEKRRVTTLITDIDRQILELNESIINAKRELGELPSETTQAIEGFGAWKKTLTTFRQQVGDVRVQLFDDSTINQFGSLEEALKKTAEEYKKNIALVATYDDVLKSTTLTAEERAKIEGERAEADAMAKLAKKALDYYNTLPTAFDKSKGGRTSDPRLQNLKEEISLYEKLYQEYKQYEKAVGSSKAAEYMEREAKDTIDALAEKYGIGLPKNVTDLTAALEILYKKMQALPSKVFNNLDKELKEFRWKIEKVDIDESQKNIEAELKRLADRISRTKTAKEFYEKILGMTGDVELAAKVSLSIYGDTGYDLQKQLTERIRTYFDNENVKVEIPVDVITADNQINYKRLGEFAEQMKETLGEEPYKAIKKIAEEGQKDLAKTYEGYLKDLEKAKTYADKRVELARTTAAKIREIESNPQYSKEQKEELKRGYQEREDREAAKLEYEAFKDTPLYVQMFEDLEHASTSTLEMMKSRLESLSRVWGTALDPTQLKEIQSRMNEIDKQLRERNPFKTLKESYRQYRDAVKSVSVEGAAENAAAASTTFYERAKMYGADSAQARAAEKELKAREKILEISKQLVDANGKRLKGQDALNAAARKSFDLETNRRVELEMASAEETALRKESKYDDPNKDPEVIAAHEAVEKAKEEWELAKLVSEILQENAKRSKMLKENIVAAAGESVQFLQAGASVASAIADTMEALGADELDVQYFRDIAEGMGNIAAGVDGLVQSIMAGSISGVISNAIGMIPNMVKGFSQIFNAGKIRKANKEIERQQEILDRLEYTYSRLEKAADSLFGADYISNYNAQMKNLQAQQTAYLRMAEAERSKGKDADDAKIAEYTNAARDAADKIQDMRNELTSKFLGTDRASAAREFAESWLEAKATFASTTDAIQSKYKDMLKSMIVEGAAAKVIDNILAPMWDNMNAMLKKSNIQGAMDYLASNMDGFLQAADSGLNALWATLEARGYDMQKLLGETSDGPTGIAHDIATASEESINGLAAGINTQNFYIAQQLQEVQRIRAIVEAGLQGSSKPSDSSNLLLMQEQAMNHYAAIEANTAATVARLDSVVRMLEGVITPRGTKGARGIQVWT